MSGKEDRAVRATVFFCSPTFFGLLNYRYRIIPGIQKSVNENEKTYEESIYQCEATPLLDPWSIWETFTSFLYCFLLSHITPVAVCLQKFRCTLHSFVHFLFSSPWEYLSSLLLLYVYRVITDQQIFQLYQPINWSHSEGGAPGTPCAFLELRRTSF